MKVNIDFGNDGISLEVNISVDGNQYCALLGDDLQSGICGFGDTPMGAIWDFKNEFRNINAANNTK